MNTIDLLNKRIDEHMSVFEIMSSDNELKQTITNISQEIIKSLKNDGRLLLCGNGGSASDAQHIAAEFVGRFQKNRKAYDAEALTVNSSSLTSIGNDYGFDSIFSRQVEAKGREGDVLIGISTSGTSGDVLEALKVGKRIGMITVMLKGNKDNDGLNNYCDYILSIPDGVTARIQEAHIFVGHCIAEIVEEELFL